MSNEDEFKILVGGYFGISEMDEYDLKVYIMKDIEEYIHHFIKENPILHYDYQREAEKIKDQLSLKRKSQDALLTLRKINAPLEIELLVKARLSKLKKND